MPHPSSIPKANAGSERIRKDLPRRGKKITAFVADGYGRAVAFTNQADAQTPRYYQCNLTSVAVMVTLQFQRIALAEDLRKSRNEVVGMAAFCGDCQSI